MVLHVDGDTEAATRARTALTVLVEEMTLLSGGVKPMFRVTFIDSTLNPQIVLAARSDTEAADFAWPPRPDTTPAPLASLLRSAEDVLADNPGRAGDFTPYVVVLSGSDDVDADALDAAKRLKKLDIAAGEPRLVVFDFTSNEHSQMRDIASRPELYVRLEHPEPVASIFPIVGSAVIAGPTGAAEVDALVERLKTI
jgi:hypothetical protein